MLEHRVRGRVLRTMHGDQLNGWQETMLSYGGGTLIKMGKKNKNYEGSFETTTWKAVQERLYRSVYFFRVCVCVCAWKN